MKKIEKLKSEGFIFTKSGKNKLTGEDMFSINFDSEIVKKINEIVDHLNKE